MKINCIIVANDESEYEIDRATSAGRNMADGLRRQQVGWELYVHVRCPGDKTGKDRAYAMYTP